MPCDYFDARVATPTLALLCTYDCVFTWANTAYADNVLMGERLADYVDAGCGKVILGQWCLPTQSFWLEGRIMDVGYCPVTAPDDTRVTRTYAGDGADCVHYGPPYVSSYDTDFRDDCTLRSGAQSDGTYVEDGFLSVAWYPDRSVYYSAGNTGGSSGTGEWHELVCNMCCCIQPGGVLYAPANPDNPAFRLAVAQCLGVPCDYYDARFGTPSLALLSNYDCVLTWANYGYDDSIAMGDVLADYVDAEYGKVVLGQWCYESDQANWLQGRIMTAAYCPITSDSSYNQGIYNLDGVDCVHTRAGGVGAYDTQFLDNCTLVAGAVSDGTFDDAGTTRLSVSWRPDRRVYYSAGNTGAESGTGDWPQLFCNICKCYFACGDADAGDCCDANGTPGCRDADCCESVCSYDPYCCETSWDGICADEAASDMACMDCVCAAETTAPVAELTAPPDLGSGCACGGIVSVEGTARDPDGTFDSYTLDYRRIGVPAWTFILNSTTEVAGGWLGDWDTTALAEGYYYLRLRATNLCSMTSTVVLSVRVDQTYGNVTVDYPPDGHVVAGNVCFDGTVFDNWCSPHTYTVDYRPSGGGPWLPVEPGQPYPGTHVNEQFAYWDTIGIPVADGDYEARVEATNVCGHVRTVILDVTVDNTAPTSIITAPLNCDAVSGVVQVLGTADDTNLSDWRLWYTGGDANGWVYINGGAAPVIGGVLADWDTTNLMPCAYTLRLRVLDQAELHCNSGDVHQSNYYVSVVVGDYCPARCDINCDGAFNGLDIAPFVQGLISSGCPPCP